MGIPKNQPGSKVETVTPAGIIRSKPATAKLSLLLLKIRIAAPTPAALPRSPDGPMTA